ncbi:MAG: polyprenyl diphosphate synthase [Candidatus Aenigmarchaeota archaeon]|nr:polyprenyl diphosphate synthase [Candidatus Aenigmarchaeota archaeon]
MIDGNRRWAQKHKQPEIFGHKKGAETFENFLRWTQEYPEIKMISVYALSTENLGRSRDELKNLWKVYRENLKNVLRSEEIRKNQIQVRVLGNHNLWRSDVKKAAKEVMINTKNYTKSVLNILLAYGGQSEIVGSMNTLIKKGIRRIPIARDAFNKFLLVKKPVDLVIRTGGYHRLSNFLLFQSAYAEIYFSDTLWPDFSKKEFDKIMKWYFTQKKKFGK